MAFLKENRKLVLEALFALLFIGLAIFFIRHQRTEIHDVGIILRNADSFWILIGILVACLYVFMQGLMYFNSFRAVKAHVSLITTIKVYLKRNFVSVFLPAGGVTSLAFFTKDFEYHNISKTKIHFASSMYGFTGVLTVLLISIPILTWAVIRKNISSNQIISFLIVCIFVGVLIFAFVSILRQGIVYRLIIRIGPGVEAFFTEMRSIEVDKKSYAATILSSFSIELIGIAHMMITMMALGFHVSLEAAVMTYITSVLVLLVSPFLKGLGAIELSMAFILTRFGFSTVDAISITLLYRFFEFWLPLSLGGLSFIFVRNNLVLRIIPAILTFILGIINIISVMTPAVPTRLNSLHEILPLYAINASNYSVLAIGLFLLVISAFLLKGLKTTWYIALGLTLFSLVGHLTKAIDYEEAIVAAIVALSLIMTRKQYFIKPHPKWGQLGVLTAFIAIIGVWTYGIIGFYFLDKRYFDMDFGIMQSVKYTIQNFFLYQSDDLLPAGSFAHGFLFSLNIAGFLSTSFLLYALVRHYVHKPGIDEEERKKANELVKKYGKSGLDYFKTYDDKLYFFPEGPDGFISFRIAGNYAAVLENPVCENQDTMKAIIRQFDKFCEDNGLKSFYYRVPEEDLGIYEEVHKKSLLIGQEAIIDLKSFSLDGGSKKSIRNACNKSQENGYFPRFHFPPVKEGVLQKIKTVSAEWLEENELREMVFSQGLCNVSELRNQVIITIENHEEKVVAFLNLIPDYAEGEVTFDMIRKSKDAPNGIVDFLMVETIKYCSSRGHKYFNLGFAPMSGIEKGRDFPEKSIKFAYEKIRSFSTFKGLRDFKDKYDPEWKNRYIIYDHHYDLFNIPSILSKVIKF